MTRKTGPKMKKPYYERVNPDPLWAHIPGLRKLFKLGNYDDKYEDENERDSYYEERTKDSK